MQSFREYSRKKLSLQINCSITDTRHVLNWILIIMNSSLRFYTLLALLSNIAYFLHVVTTMIKGVSRQVKPTRIQSDFSTNNISKSVSLEFKLFPLLYNYGFIFQVFSIAPRENQQEQFSIFRLTGLLLLIRDIQWYTSNLGTVQYLTDPQDSVQLFLTHYSMWCIKMF